MTDESTRHADEASPFGDDASGRGRRIVRFGIMAGVLFVVVAVVYVLTRDAAPSGAGKDEHAAMSAGGGARDTSATVMLTAADARRIGVTYAVVTAGALIREVRTVGQVTFDETRVRTISPKIDGWVERLYVDATGQFVARGAPLMSVYSPMLVSAQEELLLARRLAADVAGGTPEAERSAAELVSSTRQRFAFWDIPESEVALVERSGEVRRALTLRSAVSGFVLEKNVLEGQRIMAGDALYRIADLRVVWLEGEVFEQDLGAIALDRPVTATFEAFPGQEWKGRIAYVYPTLTPETRTARVRAELPNPGLRLKPGMYATFRFTAAGRTGALSVPRSAVLATGERNLVFVKREEGVLEPREVRVGGATNDRIEVLAGVAEGETVVASATFLVDAESNLGSALGGMGNMPGMDMTTPSAAGDRPRAVPAVPAAPSAPRSQIQPGTATPQHSRHERR